MGTGDVTSSIGSVVLDVYDPDYFIAFSFANIDAVTLVNAPQGCSLDQQAAAPLDDAMAAILALIPPDGDVPPDLTKITKTLMNRTTLTCVS